MDGLINKSEVATGVVTNLVEDAVKSIWERVKKHFKDASIQEDIELGIAYEQYLARTKEKYGQIKTLIYRRVKEDLYSFYVDSNLLYKDITINSSDINNLITLTNKIIITGTGGVGKSTLMHHLFLNTIKVTDYIPVLIELRSLNSKDEISIRNEIYKTLSNNGFELNDEYFEFSLKAGGYIFLFDGYDEVNKDINKKVSEEIQSFSDKYNKNNFIISSRPSSEFIGWNDFDEISTMPLSKEQAIELIKKLKFDETIKNKFLDELENGLYDKHKSFAENPLLLTIMLLTYESSAKIPENTNDFYERAFLVLFSDHDALKDAYERDTCTKLSYDKFKRIFSYICFISYFENVYEFTDVSLNSYLEKAQKKYPDIIFNTEDFQEDLLQHVCMLIKDGLSYRFTHRSFQEYFAALYTCQLTDEKQKNLFYRVLNNHINHEEYYIMLFDMQENRFMQNILLPCLNQLKNVVGSKEFSSKVIAILCERFWIEIKNRKVNVLYSISNDDVYYHNILTLIRILFKDEYTLCYQNEIVDVQHYYKELFESIATRRGIEINYEATVSIEIGFNELTDPEKILLTNSYVGIKARYLLSMNILDKYSSITSEENTLSDLLMEL